jgi:hypothetical protein
VPFLAKTEIFNSVGTSYYQGEVRPDVTSEILVQDWPSGIYFVQIKNVSDGSVHFLPWVKP